MRPLTMLGIPGTMFGIIGMPIGMPRGMIIMGTIPGLGPIIICGTIGRCCCCCCCCWTAGADGAAASTFAAGFFFALASSF